MNQLSGRSCNRNRYTMVHKPHQNPSMLLEHNFPTFHDHSNGTRTRHHSRSLLSRQQNGHCASGTGGLGLYMTLAPAEAGANIMSIQLPSDPSAESLATGVRNLNHSFAACECGPHRPYAPLFSVFGPTAPSRTSRSIAPGSSGAGARKSWATRLLMLCRTLT